MVDVETKEMEVAGNNASDVAASLVDTAVKDGKAEVTEETELVVNKDKPITPEKPQAQASANAAAPVDPMDYRSKAFDNARQILKDKTDLSDDEINKFIYQRYLSAGRNIQRREEALQEAQKQVDSLNPYKQTYDNWLKVPEFVALLNGQAKIVMNSQLPDRQGEEFDDTPPAIRKLQERFDGYISKQEQREAEGRAAQERERATAQTQEMNKAIGQEISDLSSKYSFSPTFKGWIEYRDKYKMLPPELEDIIDNARKDGVTLTYAVKSWFAENGIPKVAEAARQNTIKELEKKAGQFSESSHATVLTAEERNYSDSSDVARMLFEDAGIKI